LRELRDPGLGLGESPRQATRGGVLELLGILLLAAAALWVYGAAAAGGGGNPDPPALLLLACGGAIAVAWLVGPAARWLVPTAVLAAAAWIALRGGDFLSPRPLGGPFGYANATAAFFVQLVVAALMAATALRTWALRGLLLAAAVAAALVPFAVHSVAGVLTLMLTPVALLAVAGPRGARAAVGASAALVGLVLTATVVLGATFESDRDSASAEPLSSVLSERRLVLWSEALAIMGDEPLTGVGPGRFQAVSPTALDDQDALWAHHGFLQVGAETGVPGLLLLVSLFVWGFARLWVRPQPDAVTALGAVALAALGVHASVDYVLHFPAIPITAAALVGAATVSPKERDDTRLDRS
jgi:O-antigen ligase